ncbi:hypothetical protein PISMIDRAFT_676929 [Pisolithus microcarpus 441]|uniref:Uncharacterized protein n=1 Tax=Pisolithus microcarpus 441 TaxID=765257 RepID=A0A0C9ZI20_9AGAM|nr:hypothetical protein PISMIDRAFT_676929 [Pisolithus microcarpus 441]
MLVHGECGAVESHHDGPVVRCYSNISRDAVFAVKPVFPHLRKYGPSDCQSPLAAIWYLCHRFVLIAWNRDFELVPFLERLWRFPQYLHMCHLPSLAMSGLVIAWCMLRMRDRGCRSLPSWMYVARLITGVTWF